MGDRDPAQPLLTLHAGGRVELSGATTANWVSKTANLLVDALGAPRSLGLALPLHWQSVVLVLAGAATGAEVVLATRAEDLTGCDVVFVRAEEAEAGLATGAEEVLALSGHPLGAPCGPLPALVQDYAREVPGHGDHFGGAAAGPLRVRPAPALVTCAASDRVLTVLDPASPDGLGALLGPLAAGAALVLVPHPEGLDLAALASMEKVTATTGCTLPGVPRLR